MVSISCTPVECLHTIFLGAFKYLLSEAMSTLITEQKKELLSQIQAFNYSGITGRLLGNVCCYHKQFFGRDYKVVAQIAPFTICNFLPTAHIRLGQVYLILCTSYTSQLHNNNIMVTYYIARCLNLLIVGSLNPPVHVSMRGSARNLCRLFRLHSLTCCRSPKSISFCT